MIKIDVFGRCGNQMFQYAYARVLSLKTGKKIQFDFSRFSKMDKSKGWEDSLQYFNTVDCKRATINMPLHLKCFNLLLRIIDRFTRNNKLLQNKIQVLIQPIANKIGILWLSQGYYKFKINKKKDIYLRGCFESSKYFNEIKPLLMKEFTPKYPKLEKNEKLYNKIESTKSICISIRRGDFVSDNSLKQNYYICDSNYFQKAVSLAKELLGEDVTLFVFSDDVIWAKENLNFGVETYYESGDDPIWEKLRLMYSCKHFIISNSTFSWWAQYLGKYEHKIVISPSIWRRNFDSIIDLIEDDFYLINVE